MSTPYLLTEDICWAIKRELDANLAVNLTEVQDRRNMQYGAEVADLLLPYPVRLGVGFNLKILELPPEEYPRISVVGAPRGSQGDTFRGDRLAKAQHFVLLEWVIMDQDQERATVLAWRYGEAILQTLLGGYANFAGFTPMTSISDTNEAQPTEIVVDRARPSSRAFIAGGSTTIPLEGIYSL